MNHFLRTHTCGQLNASFKNQHVILCGWVHRRRDHGGLIFIDLRDKYGLTQLIFDPKRSETCYETASQLKGEWVIAIEGEVVLRQEGMKNSKLSTGEIEIEVSSIEILSRSKVLPFSIHEDLPISDELKLKYRYLDIRKGKIAEKLKMRHQATMAIRNYFDSQGFIEISTPILGKSTPEGAREYIVPSRVFPGNFYALPQSPQIFKQLLMVSGMDKYFQIAPCFRDEDLRADRQPEFTQIDVEFSFGVPEKLYSLIEGLMKALFEKVIGEKIHTPFLRMTHTECMEKYGSDKPDLRFGMPFERLDDIVNESTCSILKGPLEKGGSCKAFCVKKGAELSRKQIEEYTETVKNFSLPGIAWIKKIDGTFSSSVLKFFTNDQLLQIQERLGMADGDLVLIGSYKDSVLNQALDHLRRDIARKLNLIDFNLNRFLWVTDFPLFMRDEETGNLRSEHHPFTHPRFEDLHLLDKDPLAVKSLGYDLVLNGYEIGSGSQRIHDEKLQQKIFDMLGLSQSDINSRFGFFTEALQYGTPPHLGIGLGLDRIVMILTKTENIKDVIAFPKTTKASDLMMQAPSTAPTQHLKELQIKTEPTPISWP